MQHARAGPSRGGGRNNLLAHATALVACRPEFGLDNSRSAIAARPTPRGTITDRAPALHNGVPIEQPSSVREDAAQRTAIAAAVDAGLIGPAERIGSSPLRNQISVA